MPTLTIPTLLLIALVAQAAEQIVNLRPGKYETTAEIDMPGMKMSPQKDVDCITAADLKDLSKKLMDPEFAEACKVSGYKVVGNKLTFNTDCKSDDLHMKGTTEMTFAGESFTGVMTTKDSTGRVMTIKTSAKRIGECSK